MNVAELGDFDEKQNKYLELSGTLHTTERCQSLKSQQIRTKKDETQSPPQSKQPLTIEQMDVRLRRVEKMLFNQGT